MTISRSLVAEIYLFRTRLGLIQNELDFHAVKWELRIYHIKFFKDRLISDSFNAWNISTPV